MAYTEELETTALASWFGSNRMLGKYVGEELTGCTLAAVPFAGGLSELARPAQERCKARDGAEWDGRPDFDWAVDYFVCCWMARNGEAGKKREFEAGYSLRYTDTGGDSAVRFRSATRSLIAWRRILERATFTAADAFDFLAKCKDRKGYGIYCDPPWVEEGHDYRHSFTDSQHRRLASVLSGFRESRVVVRYGDCALVREIYPTEYWRWRCLTGRTQANSAKSEVLLINDAREHQEGLFN